MQNDGASVDVIPPYLQFGKSYCGRVRRLRDVDVGGYTSSRLCKREQDWGKTAGALNHGTRW
jgi:hypothetical protein